MKQQSCASLHAADKNLHGNVARLENEVESLKCLVSVQNQAAVVRDQDVRMLMATVKELQTTIQLFEQCKLFEQFLLFEQFKELKQPTPDPTPHDCVDLHNFTKSDFDLVLYHMMFQNPTEEMLTEFARDCQ